MKKVETRIVAGGRVTLVLDADGHSWGVLPELEGVEWKINWHTNETKARQEFDGYLPE